HNGGCKRFVFRICVGKRADLNLLGRDGEREQLPVRDAEELLKELPRLIDRITELFRRPPTGARSLLKQPERVVIVARAEVAQIEQPRLLQGRRDTDHPSTRWDVHVLADLDNDRRVAHLLLDEAGDRRQRSRWIDFPPIPTSEGQRGG